MIQDTLVQGNMLLAELRSLDLGYPLGENIIVLPAQPTENVEKVLRELDVLHFSAVSDFYRLCDGISWPDVHNGYFIKPLEKLIESNPDSEPNRTVGSRSEPVLTVGSTGGGDLFVLGKSSQQILLLPPDWLVSGVYRDTNHGIRTLASGFTEFFAACVDDLAAFVHDTPGYVFLKGQDDGPGPIGQD